MPMFKLGDSSCNVNAATCWEIWPQKKWFQL